MTHLQDFLKQRGIPQDWITELSKEELPEGKKLEDYLNEWENTQSELYKVKLKNKFKGEKDEAFSVFKKTLSAKINKKFDLGFNRNEAEEQPWEDLLDKITDSHKLKVEEARNIKDGELKQKVVDWQEKYTSAINDLELYKEQAEKNLEEKISEEKKNTQKLYNKVAFTNAWSEFELPPSLKPYENDLKTIAEDMVFSRYVADIEGNVVGIDGGKAMSFDEKSIHNDMKGVLTEVWKIKGWNKKDNLGEGAVRGQGSVPGSSGTKELGAAAKALQDRILASQKS